MIDSPLDMETPWFYLSRKKLINKKIILIKSFSNIDIMNEIIKIWTLHFNKNIIGINWNKWSMKQIIEISQCIGSFGIAMICLKLSKNYPYWSGGMVCIS